MLAGTSNTTVNPDIFIKMFNLCDKYEKVKRLLKYVGSTDGFYAYLNGKRIIY